MLARCSVGSLVDKGVHIATILIFYKCLLSLKTKAFTTARHFCIYSGQSICLPFSEIDFWPMHQNLVGKYCFSVGPFVSGKLDSDCIVL